MNFEKLGLQEGQIGSDQLCKSIFPRLRSLLLQDVISVAKNTSSFSNLGHLLGEVGEAKTSISYSPKSIVVALYLSISSNLTSKTSIFLAWINEVQLPYFPSIFYVTVWEFVHLIVRLHPNIKKEDSLIPLLNHHLQSKTEFQKILAFPSLFANRPLHHIHHHLTQLLQRSRNSVDVGGSDFQH